MRRPTPAAPSEADLLPLLTTLPPDLVLSLASLATLDLAELELVLILLPRSERSLLSTVGLLSPLSESTHIHSAMLTLTSAALDLVLQSVTLPAVAATQARHAACLLAASDNPNATAPSEKSCPHPGSSSL